jgi:nucleoside 2-deoxyribosyltransferase
VKQLRVYFAHPCFNPSQERVKKDFLKNLTSELAVLGCEGSVQILDPFLFSPNIEGDPEAKVRLSESVKSACLQLLEACEVVIALTDWEDTGVAFEAGYAHCLKKPVLLVSRATCDSANAMLIGAARARFDRVFESTQMGELAVMLKRFLH